MTMYLLASPYRSAATDALSRHRGSKRRGRTSAKHRASSVVGPRAAAYMKLTASLSIIISGALMQTAFTAPSNIDRGRYLVSVMDCQTCHTDGALIGKPDLQRPLAGSSIGHQVDGLGVFWPPNLTPDIQTGLGKWSVKDIVIAITQGSRPDGRELAPAMPWRSYSNLSQADAYAIAAYLKSLPPITSTMRQPVAPDAPVTTAIVRVQQPSTVTP
jgi:mono/diheme cytochrome c family protein